MPEMQVRTAFDGRFDGRYAQILWLLLRQIGPVSIAVVGIWLLRDRFLHLDLSQIRSSLGQVEYSQWGLAVAATGASFWAVGRYDDVIHGLMGTGINARTARLSGATSIAIAQFAGFGILTGALVRWRLLTGFTLWQSIRLSAAVSASFLVGWAVVTALCGVVTGPAGDMMRLTELTVLLLTATVISLSFWQPPVLRKLLRHLPFELPPVRALGAIVTLASIDLAFAGGALYILLPASVDLPFGQFFMAFLLATGAGLIGGTPGGIGPFEVALVGLLPAVQNEPLLASVLAYRFAYYALPAALATLSLAAGASRYSTNTRPVLNKPADSAFLPADLERLVWRADHAEANLLRQRELACLVADNRPCWLAGTPGQTLAVLGKPLQKTSDTGRALGQISGLAHDLRRGALLYKCPARTAVIARNLGWSVTAAVQEAWLRPMEFSTHGSRSRQLRRMLRKAEAGGVSVFEGGQNLPLEDMQKVCDAWAANHGGERGFSMGQFQADYVSCQRVFIARDSAAANARIIAFITLHEAQNEWALDLMRHVPGVPDGTMHLLVRSAIESAAKGRIGRLSLAAVPYSSGFAGACTRAARRRIYSAGGGDGLRRFKSSFAPCWSTFYAAAPGKMALVVGLYDVLNAINTTKSSCQSENS